MASKLLNFLLLGRCGHQFSWPRRWPDGDYYQVCLLCGDEYKYDWKLMRRIEHVSERAPQHAREGGARPGRTCTRKKLSWSPRARRIKLLDLEIQFREKGADAWHDGRIENISASGVFFRAQHVLPEDTEIEMILEMPAEICGQRNSKVLASGLVVRFVQPTLPGDLPALAAGIWDYKFLDHENQLTIEQVF